MLTRIQPTELSDYYYYYVGAPVRQILPQYELIPNTPLIISASSSSGVSALVGL